MKDELAQTPHQVLSNLMRSVCKGSNPQEAQAIRQMSHRDKARIFLAVMNASGVSMTPNRIRAVVEEYRGLADALDEEATRLEAETLSDEAKDAS
jgi:NifU-like protein involved in Fe-S cluster formation